MTTFFNFQFSISPHTDAVAPISAVRGSRDYRLQLAENILMKFYYDELAS